MQPKGPSAGTMDQQTNESDTGLNGIKVGEIGEADVVGQDETTFDRRSAEGRSTVLAEMATAHFGGSTVYVGGGVGVVLREGNDFDPPQPLLKLIEIKSSPLNVRRKLPSIYPTGGRVTAQSDNIEQQSGQTPTQNSKPTERSRIKSISRHDIFTNIDVNADDDQWDTSVGSREEYDNDSNDSDRRDGLMRSYGSINIVSYRSVDRREGLERSSGNLNL